ncbi:hypothetical protein GE21DRAFT_1306968 [Neurospora crassa]|nr:hypothetical protein GE21DRAFT_1306968 [Neurospora crassa]
MNKPTISTNALAKTNDTISKKERLSHQIPESYPPPSLVQANPAGYRRAMSYPPTTHQTTFPTTTTSTLSPDRRGGTQSRGTSVHTVRPYLGTDSVVRFPGVERSPNTDTCRIKPRS